MRSSSVAIRAEMVASVLQLDVVEGDRVEVGQQLCLLESMKMEIPVLSDRARLVAAAKVVAGDVVQEGDELLTLSV